MYWKLAITKCFGKAMVGFILSMAQALNGLEWSNQSGTQQFIMMALAVGSAWSIVDAFLDTTMQRLSETDKKAIASEMSRVLTDAVVTTTTVKT